MPSLHLPADSSLQFGQGAGRRRLREQGLLHVHKRKAPDTPNDDLVPFGIPLEDGAGSEPELPPNRGRDGHLPLRGQLRVPFGHGTHITTVIWIVRPSRPLPPATQAPDRYGAAVVSAPGLKPRPTSTVS